MIEKSALAAAVEASLQKTGLVLVPKEPTVAMLALGLAERDVSGVGERGLRLVYRAMIGAA